MSRGADGGRRRALETGWPVFLVRLVVGLGVSSFFIWLTLRGRDVDGMVEALLQVDRGAVIICFVAFLGTHIMKTLRWWILVDRVVGVSAAHMNRSMAVGSMALLLLPMRLGELGRPWLISRPDPGRPGEPPIRMSTALGTLVIERLVDGLLISSLLLGGLLFVDTLFPSPAWFMHGSVLVFLAFCGVTGLAFLASRMQTALGVMLSRVASPLGERVTTRVLDSSSRVIGGLVGPGSAGRKLAFGLLTVAYWGLNLFALHILVHAFGIELTLLQSSVVLGAQVVGIMIPSGPAVIGTFQFFTLQGLALFVPLESDGGAGLAFANLLWLLLFTHHVMLGLVFMPWRQGVMSRLASGEVEAQKAEEAVQASAAS